MLAIEPFELSLYIRTTWMLSAQTVLKVADIGKIRFLGADEAETLAEQARRRNVFARHSRENNFYVQRAKGLADHTITIHGGMRLEDRIRAEGVFKTESEVLVATEAAGEGINLQFCHLMINYDIPWNPNRLEQRMGRIHRYGQTKEVFVFNLVAEDTREGRVLTKLFEKLREIRNTLGSDKVFDVLSEILYDRNLSQLLMEAAANARSIDEILKEIDIQVDADYVARVKENLGDSLATRYVVGAEEIKDKGDRAP